MAVNVEDLIKLKKRIEKAKLDQATAEGALQQCMKQLETEYGCKTLKQAQKKLEEMTEEHKKLEKGIKKAIEELEENYDF